MCYHKEEMFSAKELLKKYQVPFPEAAAFEPRKEVNGFEHRKSPIVMGGSEPSISLFHWGLLPDWARDLKHTNNTLNAKFETLLEKPSFKPYVQNRCLVPSTGLYEWLDKGKVKEKNLIRVAESPIFSLAGLWNVCPHPLTGLPYASFTCVTNDGFVAILEDEEAWLKGGELHINERLLWTSLVDPQLDLFA